MARIGKCRCLVVGLMIGMVGVTVAPAEEPATPAVGIRVRVTAPAVSGERLVGTLVRMDETTLTLRAGKGKGTLEVPRAAIIRLEVSRSRSRKGEGAGIGMLVGIGAAVAVGLGAGGGCESVAVPDPWLFGLSERLDRNLCVGKGEAALLTSLVTIPVGALIGYAAAPGERWVATTPDRLRLAVAPVRGGGVGATLSVRF